MSAFPKDVFIELLCRRYFDGLTLARTSEVCRAWHGWITNDARFKRLMDLHYVWLTHVNEFSSIIEPTPSHHFLATDFFRHTQIGDPCFWLRLVRSVMEEFGCEGGRWYHRCDSPPRIIYYLNDFYDHSGRSVRLVEKLKSLRIPGLENFLLIQYEPLPGVGRHQAAPDLGEIHRGTTVWIKMVIGA